MNGKHFTTDALDRFAESDLDERAQVEMDGHLRECANCRARLTQTQRFHHALRAIPRADAPRDLVARISAQSQARIAQEQARRSRALLTAIATGVSALLLVWFGAEVLIALEDKNTVEFFAWIVSHPELFSMNFADTLLAVFELLPMTEAFLTLFALITVAVLAKQWLDAIAPREKFFSGSFNQTVG